ncbi:hypothetical protein HNR12_001253 [Streptomonospora nanhaiensis]|uniref:Uncharacterized protein n=1 Tax=Streptomonospora nanhaiensis TaxID=1323731 RepID=A0A853BKC5_9ACTN|nr:hypothetical protein [Streptomonospora nanhaiensis]
MWMFVFVWSDVSARPGACPARPQSVFQCARSVGRSRPAAGQSRSAARFSVIRTRVRVAAPVPPLGV